MPGVRVGGMPETRATHYHAQLGHLRQMTIKGLIVSRALELYHKDKYYHTALVKY